MNTQLNFDNYLIHASGFHNLMTEPKAVADKVAGRLSETTKKYVRQCYLEERHGRKKEVNTKQMEKGTLQEEAAITLYSRFRKRAYHKNTLRLTNKFMTGEPDMVDNHEDIYQTEEGVDVKCAWDIFTMPFKDETIDKAYYWQDQGYMFLLPNSKRWITAHCLVNAPADMIVEAKKKLYFAMRCPADNDPTYLEKCVQIERNMIFNLEEFIKELAREKKTFDFDMNVGDWNFDIPLAERIVEFKVERSEMDISMIPVKVAQARRVMNDLAKGIL